MTETRKLILQFFPKLIDHPDILIDAERAIENDTNSFADKVKKIGEALAKRNEKIAKEAINQWRKDVSSKSTTNK